MQDMGLEADIIVDECLYGDRSSAQVLSFLSRFNKTDGIALVSHMPLIFELLCDLIGGQAEIELRNGSIACVEFKGKAAKGGESSSGLFSQTAETATGLFEII